MVRWLEPPPPPQLSISKRSCDSTLNDNEGRELHEYPWDKRKIILFESQIQTPNE